MWCFIVLGALGLLAGIVFAFIEGDFAIIGPCLFVGIIAGLILAVVISIGAWIFVPSDGYILEETQNVTLRQNDDDELMYFNLTHDENNTYLYYMGENHEIKKVYLDKAEVRFITAGETTRIERYSWRYKNNFLQAIACVPLTRMNSITYIYISEADWFKHTDGGIETVVVQPTEN